MEEFNNVISPIKVLKENSDMLLKYYVSQYGERYYDLIKHRSDNTIYIFDTTPDFAFQKTLENKDKINDDEYIERLEIEARDYIAVKDRLINERDNNRYNLFCNAHNINKNKNDISFSNSLEIMYMMNSGYEKYVETCKKYGVFAIDNKYDAMHYFKMFISMDRKLKYDIVKQTLWGQNVKDRLSRENNFNGLFETFGKTPLLEFDAMLSCAYYKIREFYNEYSNGNIRISNSNIFSEKVKILKENARNNGYYGNKK